jgi:hypothetical protein
LARAIQQQQAQINSLANGNSQNINVSGTTTTQNLAVAGAATIQNLTVTGTATIQNLTVVNAVTTKDLTVTGIATIAELKVTGSAEFAGDIKLTNGVGNTRNAITKKFKASKPITAGAVVIADPANDGQVTTTTLKADRKVLGIAASTAINAGDDIEVAIGGTLQVQLDATTVVIPGDLITSSNQDGQATIAPEDARVGTILGKATGQKDSNNLVWLLITLR